MSYVIRTVPERMWFVTKYMLPELYKQGIIDVNVYEDTYHYGCLHSFKTVVNASKDDGVWYLQDDIILYIYHILFSLFPAQLLVMKSSQGFPHSFAADS